jgi:hypothetical protein
MMPTMRAAVLLALLSACTSAADRECRVAADCASGVCRTGGTCGPVTPSTSDAAAQHADAGQPDGLVITPDGARSCANHDGTIGRDEVTFAAELRVPFRVAANAMVDTAGVPQDAGRRRWDLSLPLAGDHPVETVTLPIAGQWFAGRYPGATYATQLADGQDLLGIFEATSDALLLRGVASPAQGPGATQLVYDPPAKILAFPMRGGASWSTTSTVTGTVLGALLTYSEQYASSVDAEGTLVTPFGEFPVLRVRTTLTRTVGLTVTTVRSFTFEAECYGTVGAIASLDNEPAAEFQVAREVRRLTP